MIKDIGGGSYLVASAAFNPPDMRVDYAAFWSLMLASVLFLFLSLSGLEGEYLHVVSAINIGLYGVAFGLFVGVIFRMRQRRVVGLVVSKALSQSLAITQERCELHNDIAQLHINISKLKGVA